VQPVCKLLANGIAVMLPIHRWSDAARKSGEDLVIIEKILTHLNQKALAVHTPLVPDTRAPPQAGLFDTV